MTLRAAILAGLLAGCAAPRGSGPWTVAGAVDASTSAEALELVAAARRVLPDPLGLLAGGGTIAFLPDLRGVCPVERAGDVPTGCIDAEVYVLWPTPWGGDLAGSALPHELAHAGLASGQLFATEDQAEAGALLIVQEWRRTRGP